MIRRDLLIGAALVTVVSLLLLGGGIAYFAWRQEALAAVAFAALISFILLGHLAWWLRHLLDRIATWRLLVAATNDSLGKVLALTADEPRDLDQGVVEARDHYHNVCDLLEVA